MKTASMIPWSVFLVTSACATPWDLETVEDGMTVYAITAATDRDGELTLRIPVQDEKALLLTVTDDAGLVFVSDINAPGGQRVFTSSDHWTSDYSVTNGIFASNVATINWPITADDAPLVPGTWVVNVRSEFAYHEITAQVLLKNESDLDDGFLSASLIYTDGTEGDADLVAATEQAVELWRDLYADIGLDLDLTYDTAPGRPLLPVPDAEHSEMYTELSEQAALRDVLVVMGSDIDFETDVYGLSGDIPGPLVPSRKSAVLLSALFASGADGLFSDTDIQLLGETMAHETAHFLGLYHPVEATYDHWDSLDDTQKCSDMGKCIDKLGNNLMFPYPICTAFNCTPQNMLTDDQRGVMHRYVGVE